MPRHPPCTLSSLTTFTDHRHTGQVSRPVHLVLPAGLLQPTHATRPVPRSHRKGARLVRTRLDSPPPATEALLPRRTRPLISSGAVNHATHKKTLRDKTIHLSKSSTSSLAPDGFYALANADEGTPVERDPIVRVPSKIYQEIVGLAIPTPSPAGSPAPCGA